MTKAEFNELIRRRPNLAARNPVGGTAQGAQPERAVRHEPMAEAQRKESHSSRVSVRITSFRRRLIDPDNLCGKFFTDCLRYAGIIKDDTSKHITLTVTQEQVASKTDERTEILVIG